MKKVVFASGIWNVLLGLLLVSPAFYTCLCIRIPHPFWGWMLTAFLWYTGAVLILASRDLKRRAALVYWESFLRYGAAALFLSIGYGVVGWSAWVLGATDLAWGMIYMFGLPRALGATHKQLFLDAMNEGG